MTHSSAVLVGSLIKLWNNRYGNKSELNGGAQQPLLCFTCCEHDVLNFLLPSQINDREAAFLKSFPYTCSLTSLHSYSSDNKEKRLQQLHKYQSFKTRLELTLLLLILSLYKFYLFSCVICTLKSTVMDDSNLSQPHSRSSLHWKCLFTQILLEIQQQSSALWQLSMVKPVHISIFHLCVPAATLAWVYFVWSMIQNEHSSHVLSVWHLLRVKCWMILEVWITGAWQSLKVPSPLCHGRGTNPALGTWKALYLCSSPGEFHSITNYLIFFLFPGYLLLGCVALPSQVHFTELVLKCSSSAFSKDLINCFVLDVLELGSTP